NDVCYLIAAPLIPEWIVLCRVAGPAVMKIKPLNAGRVIPDICSGRGRLTGYTDLGITNAVQMQTVDIVISDQMIDHIDRIFFCIGMSEIEPEVTADPVPLKCNGAARSAVRNKRPGQPVVRALDYRVGRPVVASVKIEWMIRICWWKKLRR